MARKFRSAYFGIAIVSMVVVAAGLYASSATPPGVDEITTVTVNSGLYRNRIPVLAPPNDYTEICVRDGQVWNDQHVGGEKTFGGDCNPGDVGWIVEQDERPAAVWEVAKMDCLKDGMRLLEVFEFKISCNDATVFGLNDMTGNWEWESNTSFVHPNSNSVSAPVGGYLGCGYHSHGEFGRPDGNSFSFAYRCAR